MIVYLGHGVFSAVVFVHNRFFRFFVANIDQFGAFDLDECSGAVRFVTYPKLNRIVVIDHCVNAFLAVPCRDRNVAIFLVQLPRIVIAIGYVLRIRRTDFARLYRLFARQNSVEPLFLMIRVKIFMFYCIYISFTSNHNLKALHPPRVIIVSYRVFTSNHNIGRIGC